MAVAGDEQSQGHARAQALYDRYYRNVYKYALSQLRSAQDAEDAAQNTFLRAFAAMQKGVVPENEVAWLFKIAHNVCASSKLAWLRRRRVETPRDLELLPTEPEAPEPPREELAGLDGALAAMPPRLREAFLLREWQGLSYAEIAERLDTSHSAVETLIFRARRHLANELQKVQTLLLTPAAGWIRNFVGGGGGAVLRGAGVVAVAAGITAAATVPSNTQPARTGPHSVRAGSAPEGALLPVSDQSRQRQRQNGTAAAPRRHTTPSRPIDVPSGGAPKTDEQLSTPEATPTTTLVTTTVARTTAQPPTQTVRSGVVATTTVVPDVTLPAATTPTVTTPSVTVPSVTTPVVTTPTLTVPPVTVPDPPHLP